MNPYAIICALLFSVGLATTGWHYGAANERVAWEKEKLEMQDTQRKVIEETVAENNRVLESNNANNVKVAQDHEAKIAQLNKEIVASNAKLVAVGGLRITRAVCDKPTFATEATSNSNHDAGIAGTIELPQEVTRNLLDEADHADKIVEQLREAQEWIKAHGFYGESH